MIVLKKFQKNIQTHSVYNHIITESESIYHIKSLRECLRLRDTDSSDPR